MFSVTKLHFNDYYITPVQRVPRYGLLIRDLLKATPVTHPDYKKLRDAGERMEAIASDINLKIRESETTTHFAALLSRGSAFARLKTDVRNLALLHSSKSFLSFLLVLIR